MAVLAMRDAGVWIELTPPTPVLTLTAAKQIAEEEGICHVYLGNVSL